MNASRVASLSAIFGIVFLDLLGFGILIPQLGVYGVRFHASAFQVGLLASSYSLMQLLAAPWLGRLSDVHGRRPVLLLSLIGSLVGFLLFAFSRSLPMLFASRIIDGISGGNISTAQAYVADVTTAENRAKGMGLIGAAFGLGFILGPALGGLLGSWGGNLAIGLFAAGVAGVNILLVLFYLPESKKPGTAPARVPVLSGGAFQLPNVGTCLLVFLLFSIGFAEMEGTFSVLLMARYLSTGDLLSGLSSLLRSGEDPRVRAVSLKAGQVFAVIGLVSALIQGLFIGRLKRSFGEARLLFVGLVVTAVALVWLPQAPTFAWIFVPSALLAAGSALTTPTLSSLLSLHAPPARQGEVFGTYQAMGAVGRIVGPAAGGFLFQEASPAAPYWSGALLVALGALLCLRLQRVQTPLPA